MYRILLCGIDTCMQYEAETLRDFRADMRRLMNGEPTQHPAHNRGPVLMKCDSGSAHPSDKYV